jgi:ribonucleotide monophosphatase NagD (HAD superfamily)
LVASLPSPLLTAGTLLVLTGCTSEEQLKQADPKQQPGLYVDSIADLLTIKEKLSSWDSSCTLM